MVVAFFFFSFCFFWFWYFSLAQSTNNTGSTLAESPLPSVAPYLYSPCTCHEERRPARVPHPPATTETQDAVFAIVLRRHPGACRGPRCSGYGTRCRSVQA